VTGELFYHPDERPELVAIDQPLTDGEILRIAGGIEVIHTPGHCAGQVALLWRPGRTLFAGDVWMNLMGLGSPVGFESLEEGRASQRKLAGLSFECCGVRPRQNPSPAMRRRGSAISGARNRRLDMGDAGFGPKLSKKFPTDAGNADSY
jgi:glyoxylase-like metal-dependent hydrolase (beta-lactamase superfamily II)